ncbi:MULTISPECIES: GMP/IMP nucleotidase [Pseudoalteromonas]|uniref:Putative hydrolase of the HAD superfamily n=1 Tax=Pseudoalteromonas peptidolytica F12-50-A1 TaxID=1315280 RepID=A0A8I0N006_9GAMM|nr:MULTISPECIES: GMP/IMP nucleotidase [Pseudoalteromonas]MBE0348089.1 putative hydrolase of the HAD superfamily [Pseudoalteromonas peptidolytica F12-50-A1]MDW7550837.1 GMP/IMP nucleotidase [Pseudoalteromonas peptidolytica]NLR15690.1 GMP/IMP nucleotidase [Pseudoalteromonas peptidolytica]RXF03763.1 GMP/IMP nucleotidase [Pseudoalteromonas sp. PS5]USD28708.1 GMP/IMP nucleotidase [Pseudoalteromonas sp. SCSIO 43201]
MLNWSNIDTVLLDMDGTLLDLHFDNHFFLDVVPKAHAKRQGLTLEAARADILARYEAVMGQIEWYCLDYWQEQLQLPIMELKREVQHLISVRDDVPEFLDALRKSGKQLILLTNAHPNSLSLKIERTQFDQYLDKLVSTHEYGVSKESQELWHQVEQDLGFDKSRTLFVDDSISVLNAAKKFGIGHLLAVANPDSQQPDREIKEYLSVSDYRTLLPIY